MKISASVASFLKVGCLLQQTVSTGWIDDKFPEIRVVFDTQVLHLDFDQDTMMLTYDSLRHKYSAKMVFELFEHWNIDLVAN